MLMQSHSSWATSRAREPFPPDGPWVCGLVGADLPARKGAGTRHADIAGASPGAGLADRIAL
jgi:hypothetical protein